MKGGLTLFVPGEDVDVLINVITAFLFVVEVVVHDAPELLEVRLSELRGRATPQEWRRVMWQWKWSRC